MSQAVPLPITRSSKPYTRHRVLCQTFNATCHCRGRDRMTVAGSSKGLTKYSMLYIQFWAPGDGWRNCLKHVEHFTEINKLRNFASCWLYMKIRLRCMNPWKSESDVSAKDPCIFPSQSSFHEYQTYPHIGSTPPQSSILRKTVFNKLCTAVWWHPNLQINYKHISCLISG